MNRHTQWPITTGLPTGGVESFISTQPIVALGASQHQISAESTGQKAPTQGTQPDTTTTYETHAEAVVPTGIQQCTMFWDIFEAFAELEHGGKVILAQRKGRTSDVVAVLELHEPRISDETVLKLLRNHHENTVTLKDVFQDHSICYLITEVLDVSLSEVISCPVTIRENQAAFISGEV
ncbi:hypothetical protein TWF106_010709 [Orbilia oligospora]|uniref:Protein kinase domain-containing protein n=1 Tax=Orbilia oligospora TaxID=2813651 RepID=A0A7C8USJ4_ORBOL|nr:hypothetical protein TWF106_010709 [Orbilia oligospora]